jgi:osmotically-inducible protein OsmY
VRGRLALSEEVAVSDIEVMVEAGLVTLQGSVTTRHMKAVAGDIAAGVPGVHGVRNRLHVTQPLVEELKELLSFDPAHDVKR